MADRNNETHFVAHALALARKGIALTSPNPCVGAVIVSSDGEIVGEGFHTYDGVHHAEVIAITQAGEKSRGASLYINLEPCSHRGRTGPCAEAIVAAGISRVVASMEDPNPLVSGKGFEFLRASGVKVETGSLEAEARLLNESFAKYTRHRIPLVTLKAAMTLDGKIAPPPRSPNKINTPAGAHTSRDWITGDAARAHSQQLRHQNDAILVGVGTILADDPLLTDRTGESRRRPLLRVILDSRLRLPLEARVVQTARDHDVMVLCSLAEEKKKKKLQKLGVRVEQIAVGTTDGRPDMAGIVSALGELEVTSVLIEGGAHVNWAALASDIVDKVFLYYAPKILAGEESIPFAYGSGFRSLRDAPCVRSLALHHFAEDFAVEGYLRDPYAD